MATDLSCMASMNVVLFARGEVKTGLMGIRPLGA